MNHKIFRILTIAGILASSLTPNQTSAACGQFSLTITNLPTPEGTLFRLAAINSSGDLTGSFYQDAQFPHIFLRHTDTITFADEVSEGYAINASSQIAGDVITTNGDVHAALLDGGNLTDLGTLGGSYGSASAINNAGKIAGIAYTANDAALDPFLFVNGAMTDLGNLGGSSSAVYGLNSGGSVVGASLLANNDQHGFLYSNGAMTDVGTLGGNYSSAFVINDAGLVAGEASLSSGDIHGVVFSAGVLTDVGTFGGTFSTAYGVNNAGMVIGAAYTASDAAMHAFVYSKGSLIDLGTLGGPNSFSSAVNNGGLVVGTADTSTGESHGFLWQNGILVDLNALLPEGSGWVLNSADFISDSGRIVGSGVYNGNAETFILDLALANQPPVATANGPIQAECGNSVALDGSQSVDPDGDLIAYQWVFGGLTIGTNAVLNTMFPLGTNVVTLVVTDPCGASAQTNVTVTVLDTTAPTIVGTPVLAPMSANGNCEAVVPDVTSQVIATDGCSSINALTISQSPAAGTSIGLGVHTIKITARDAAGNSSFKMVTLAVVDTTAPVIVSAPTPRTVSVGANCQGTVPDVLSSISAFDTCTPANQLTLSQDPAAGTVLAKGSYVITVTVTDGAGNHGSQVIPLTLADTTAPAILSAATPRTVSVGANCQGQVPNVLSSILAADNCTPANQLVLTQSPAAGTVLAKGSYVITVTATDAAGNHSSQGIPLSLVDTTAPVIQTISVDPSVLSSPNHKMTPVTVSATATDNCDSAPSLQIVSITANEAVSDGDIQITGKLTASLAASRNAAGGGRIYTITLRATDASGNSSTRTVTVSVPQGNGKK